MKPVRGRFAPSPTGEMHVGNGSTALLAWLSVRSRGGEMVLRMEDLDLPRVRPGAAGELIRDLEWLGLDWDEGPDRGGNAGPYNQSERFHMYDRAFRRLQEQRLVYPCFCSRKDIKAAASAPQEPGDEIRYPGTCRRMSVAESDDRIGSGARHAWRFRVEGGPLGDFVVRRYDGTSSYQLAVVVDDDAMGITEVVRGDDLRPSSERQVLIYRALGMSLPRFVHVPLLLGADGVRLSKRHNGVSVRELREAGFSPEQVIGRIAFLVGLKEDAGPIGAGDLVERFDPSTVKSAREGIVVGEPFIG